MSYTLRKPADVSLADFEAAVLDRAADVMLKRARRLGQVMAEPRVVRDFLSYRFAGRERESFAVLFLDNRHRLIAYRELFHGTIDGSAVHPREVVKAALEHNAAALVIANNHPSGDPTPSSADRAITDRLRQACSLIDVRLLDHFVVGDTGIVSFAERGWL